MQVNYKWQNNDSKSHYFQVTLTITGKLTQSHYSVWMPVWTPGSYLIREFSKHIQHVKAEVRLLKETHPVAIPLEKTSKNRWLVTLPKEYQNTQAELALSYRVYAFDPSVRTAYFDPNSLCLDGAAVWLSVEGTETLPRTINWFSPSDESNTADEFTTKERSNTAWTLSTALTPKSIDTAGFGSYSAAHYLEQIDTPVMAGTTLRRCTLYMSGIPHTLVFDDVHTPYHPLDLDRIQQDVERIFEWHSQFWTHPLPFSHYMALVQIFANQYGGLEHASSTRLVCSRFDLPRKGIVTNEEDYADFLGLLSHEYFHSWWVKRLRPSTLLPYTLEQEQYTPLLWMFEGFTAYFDDLSLVQTGLITSEHYLGLLEKVLDRITHSPAHLTHTLEESSFDAWIRSYRPDENTPNSTVSYYDQGSILALVLDITLQRYGSSLRAILRDLWLNHASTSKDNLAGITEHLLLEALFQAAPEIAWDSLIHEAIRTPTLPRYEEALTSVGVNVHHTMPTTAAIMAQRLGVRFKENTLIISHVLAGRSAAAAGVAVGDEWVALDHLQLTSSNWLSAFNRWDSHTTPYCTLHFFRQQHLQSLSLDYPAWLSNHSLKRHPHAQPEQQHAFCNWLHIGQTAL